MNAETAWKLSIDNAQPEIDKVEKLIIEATEGDKMFIELEILSYPAQQYLESEGFKVERINSKLHDKVVIQIGWAKY